MVGDLRGAGGGVKCGKRATTRRMCTHTHRATKVEEEGQLREEGQQEQE